MTASNRAGMVYAAGELRPLAARLDGNEAVDVVLYREGDEAVARREGEELRFARERERLRDGRRCLDPRPPGRARARVGRACEPERGRAARLGRARLGVRRPRRPSPLGRRLARLAPARRLRGADADGRPGRRQPALDHRRDAARAARTSASRRRRTSRSMVGAVTTRPDLVEQLAPPRDRATSVCSPRSAASRASCSCPRSCASRAYDDGALPIGHGATISQPFMVAAICALLELDGGERVLDVGTGSGYQAAVLAELARRGASRSSACPSSPSALERRSPRPATSRVEVRVGDGTLGVPERAPYDGIAVAAAAPAPPPALVRAAHARRPPRRPGRGPPRPAARGRAPDGDGSTRRPLDRLPLRAARGQRRVRRRDRLAHLVLSFRLRILRGPLLGSPASYGALPRRPRLRARSPARGGRSGAATTGSSSPSSAPSARAATSSTSSSSRCSCTGSASTTSSPRPARSSSRSRTTTRGTGSGRSAGSGATSPTRACGSSSSRRVALAANLLILHALVQVGLAEVLAQAVAIVLVTPFNFVGNKVWSFRKR